MHEMRRDGRMAKPNVTELTEDQLQRKDIIDKASKTRRVSVLPVDAPDGAKDAKTAWEVVSVVQLQYWAQHSPVEFFGMLNELRSERDAALHCLDEWDTIVERGQKAVKIGRDAQRQRKEAETKLAAQEEEMMMLQDQVHTLEGNIGQLNEALHTERSREVTPTPSTLQAGKRSVRHPDPPILTDGKDPEFEGWTQDIQDKLDMNADHFPSDLEQAKYVIGRTGGKAKGAITSHRVGDPDYFQNAQSVITLLTSLFGDPDKENRYRRDYTRLYQGNTPFNEFYMEFRKLTSYLGYQDKTVMDGLKDKVNPRLKEALATVPIDFTSVEPLRTYLQKVDNSQAVLIADRERASRARAARAVRQPTPGPLQPIARVPSGGNDPRAVTNPSGNKPTSPYTHPAPRPRPPFLPNGPCYNCGEEGHFISDCPKPRVVKPRGAGLNEMDMEEEHTDTLDQNEAGNE